MIDGDVIDEIKCLPEKQIHKFTLQSIENRLQNKEISERNALDICSRLILDYQLNKEQIISDLNINHKITVLDSIMGSGKSTFMIDEIINKNPQQSFLCVLPTLDECKRYSENIEADIYEPKQCSGRKLKGLQNLIANGRNIVTTHELIRRIDEYAMELLKNSNYVLVIDECLECVCHYDKNFKKSDMRAIFKDGYVYTDEQGFLTWNSDKDKNYDGRYNDIKQLCSLHSLMHPKLKNGEWSDKIIIWNFPVVFFSLFEKCYICTYLWDGSMQKAYFDLHNIEYLHMTLKDGKLDFYNPLNETEARSKKWELINLYSGNLNKIGIPDRKNRNPLSKSWYGNKVKREKEYLSIVKNNAYNYFRNIAKTNSGENMYTTFKRYRKYVGGNGYSKGFVSCNAKGTNDYRDKKSLAYLINLYPHPDLVNFFESYGVQINQDLYSLSELLQWIWRSAIRDGIPINLYIPSMRMRGLLGKWVLGKEI